MTDDYSAFGCPAFRGPVERRSISNRNGDRVGGYQEP